MFFMDILLIILKPLLESHKSVYLDRILTSELLKDRKKEGSLRFYKPKFSYIFCDMDGETSFIVRDYVFSYFLQLLMIFNTILRHFAEQ